MNATINERGRAIETTESNWQTRAIAVVAAIVVNAIILAAGRLINGDFPIATVGNDQQTIGFAQVIVVTLLVGLIAWGMLAALERTTVRARTIWTTIAVAIFAISLLGPLGSGDTTSSIVVLTCLHVGAAATIIPLMRKTAGQGGPPPFHVAHPGTPHTTDTR
ncbi:MAG TPA: DUF6069 family protein [Thermomicrobiales bacterium]|nr:DUF6069 family protein [Thermomicrobiales bacterium]